MIHVMSMTKGIPTSTNVPGYKTFPKATMNKVYALQALLRTDFASARIYLDGVASARAQKQVQQI
jgi:hypothetical protein